MNPEGHAGLSLIILSSLMATLEWTGPDAVILSLATAAFSSLPDLDLRFRPFVKHRSPLTHSLSAGVLFGTGLAVFGYCIGFDLWLGFVCGFGGTVLHLLGDIFTFSRVKPFWPFSSRAFALGLFKSSNPLVNLSLVALGGLVFLATFLA
jgi:membrane-bound metal-dependent hydrolase YbcI (DUF457 family)